MLELIINVTTKFLAREFKRRFLSEVIDSFSSWGLVKVNSQKCDVNLTRIHLQFIYEGNDYSLMWSYHFMDENWQETLVELTILCKIQEHC